jgi:hypothetical protein
MTAGMFHVSNLKPGSKQPSLLPTQRRRLKVSHFPVAKHRANVHAVVLLLVVVVLRLRVDGVGQLVAQQALRTVHPSLAVAVQVEFEKAANFETRFSVFTSYKGRVETRGFHKAAAASTFGVLAGVSPAAGEHIDDAVSYGSTCTASLTLLITATATSKLVLVHRTATSSAQVAHVVPFESKALKPRNHISGSRR